MPGCDTARNIQKYKGASASTLQDALENGNVATTSIQTSGYFIGDGSLLTGVNISGGSIGNLQGVTNNGATSTNKITLTNTNESLEAQGNVTVTSGFFKGDGGLLSNTAGTTTFQQATNQGNVSTNIVSFTNAAQSITTSGNIVVGTNVYASEFYGSGTTLTGVALSSDLSSNASRVTSLESSVTTNTSGITALETDMTSNASRVTSLESSVTTNASDITALETDMTSNASRVTSLESSVNTNASDITALETDMTSNASRVTSLESSVTTNASGITALETDMTSNASRVTSLESSVTTNASGITTLDNDMTSNASRVTSLRTDMTSNVSRIEDLEDNIIISNSSGITSGFTKGDIIFASADNTLAKRGIGNLGEVLKVGTNDTVVWASDNIGDGSTAGNLQQVTTNGSTTANMISFQNTYTSLITYGDVGIGYSSPVVVGVPLKIKAAGTSSGDDNAILIEQTDSSTTDHAIIKLKTPNSAGNPFINYNINGQTNWSHGIDNSDSDKFKIANHATNLHTNTKLTLQTDGNLGIGTNTPHAKLEISGNVYASTQFEGHVNTSDTGKNVFGKKITAGIDGFVGNVNVLNANQDIYNIYGKKITAGTDGFIGHVNKNTTDKEVYGKIISISAGVSGASFYGPISGSNNISADEITATKLISSNIYSYSGNIHAYSGNIVGNVNVSGTNYNVYAKNFKTTTGDIIITHPSRGLYGKILGNNTISADTITASSAEFSSSITSNVVTPTSGYISVCTTSKDANLHVAGNIFASNHLQSNIITPTDGFISIGGGFEPDANLYVTGNIFASNHLQSNIITPTDGFISVGGGFEPDANLHVVGNIFASNHLQSNIITPAHGFISIGTSNPDANLHVVGNIFASSNIQSNIITPAHGFISVGTSNPDANLHVVGNIFASSNIQSNIIAPAHGFISVGTSSPDAKIHVVGNVYASTDIEAGRYYTGGSIDTNRVSYYDGTKFVQISDGDDGQFLKFNKTGNAVDAPSWGTVSSSGGTQSLQSVTTLGASTDKTIIFNNTTTAFKTGTPTSSTTCGIANNAPTHTLDIGSNVAIIDDGIDKIYIRGNVYSTSSIIALNEVRCDVISARESKIKTTTVITEKPKSHIRLLPS
jgi:predicted  nucleic acid-binding Zn-ribbon protein